MQAESGVTLGGRFVLGERAAHDIPGIERFLARDQRLERDAVVDLVRTVSPSAVRNEATRASRLRDPRLARIVATGHEDIDGADTTYIVIEHVPGSRLDEVLERHRLDTRLSVAVIGGAARALAAARAGGLHHGFLRPSAVHVTDRGRVVIGGVGVDGEAAWQAGLAPLRDEAQDAAALGRLLVECSTGLTFDDATVSDLPEDLGGRARELAVAALEHRPPTTVAEVVSALSPFDSRALMGFARSVAALPPSRPLAAQAAREEAERLAREEAERLARLEATRELIDDETLVEAEHEAEAVAVEEVSAPDLRAALIGSEHGRAAREHVLENDPEPVTEPVPVAEQPDDDSPVDKYEASFDTLEMMVAEQHAAHGPGTWELVLARLHDAWPRSRTIARSLERARERARSGGPINGTVITMIVALGAILAAVWLAFQWLDAPLSPEFIIESSTPAPESPSPSPSADGSSSEPTASPES